MPTSTRHVDAPPRAVFDVVAEPTTYPDWLIGARQVRQVDPDWPEPGSEFDHEVGAGPLTTKDRTTAVGVDPGHSLDLVVRARPFLEAHVHFEIAPSGDGTLVTLIERPCGRFKLIGRLLAPLITWRNDRSLTRLARRCASTS